MDLSSARADRVQTVYLLLRFGVVGLLNTGFSYCVFAVCVLAGAGSTASLLIATVAGVAFNFQTARRLVFRSEGRGLRFVSVYVVVLGFNWLALRALHGLGVSDLVGQALLALPIAALSFTGQRLFVFRTAGPPRR